MRQATILKNNVMTHRGQFETQAELDEWLAKHIAKNTFGLPERPELAWDPINDQDIPTGVILPAEYQIVLEDISEQLERAKINEESLQYLKDTDWYVTRFMENGTPIPEDVSSKRNTARSNIVR